MAIIAKINGIAIANIAKINGIAKASIAKVDGVSISAVAWVSPTAIHSKCGEDGSWPASNTIDGNLTTRWDHSVAHEHWIIFDLGSTKTVQKIRMYVGGGSRGSICEVTAVYINDTADESGGSKGSLGSILSGTNWNEIDVTDTSGRYIKIKLKTLDANALNCSASNLMALYHEFEAYV